MRYDLITTFLVYMFPVKDTKYRGTVIKSSLLRVLQKNTAGTALSAVFGPNISDLFDLSLIRRP